MMKITALVENTSNCELKSIHGLSFYIETENHKLLFDLGPDDTIFKNAQKRNIDLKSIDTVIISHGHNDHGGALKKFLQVNSKAKIYIQRNAFENHYAKALFLKISVSIDGKLKNNNRFVLLDGDTEIDNELFLFTVSNTTKCHSPANDSLFSGDKKDDFSHEQNLIIKGNPNVLILGCGHCGIVNIMERAAEFSPAYCFGGYHLDNPVNGKAAKKELLDDIIFEIKKYDSFFYTCHCTGKKAFYYLSKHMDNIKYIECGMSVEI